MRCLYLDLDATLLGHRGSLLHDGEGATSLLGVRAIEACLRAGVEVVLMSGRRKESVAIPSRLFGQCAYIFEVGACLVLDGEEHWLTGDLVPGERGTIFEQIEASGAPALLLERYVGRLERLGLVRVQRVDPGPLEACADRRVQVVGDRLEARLASALVRLADEPLVGAAGLQEVGPGLDAAGDGHRSHAR